MARTSTAGQGHNGPPLTDDETAALQHYYADQIRRRRKAAAEAQAVYKTKLGEVNSSFALVKGHLRYTRVEFEEVLTAEEMGEREFLVKEAARTKRLALHGLKPGDQIPLDFDTVDEAILAEANGYRAGLRNDDPEPPETVSPILHPDWMRGWHRGDTDSKAKLSLAETVLAIWNKQDNGGLEGDEDDDPPVVEEDDEAEVERKAAALKEAGWTDPQVEERSFVQTDGEADGPAAPAQVAETLDA